MLNRPVYEIVYTYRGEIAYTWKKNTLYQAILSRARVNNQLEKDPEFSGDQNLQSYLQKDGSPENISLADYVKTIQKIIRHNKYFTHKKYIHHQIKKRANNKKKNNKHD